MVISRKIKCGQKLLIKVKTFQFLVKADYIVHIIQVKDQLFSRYECDLFEAATHFKSIKHMCSYHINQMSFQQVDIILQP